MPFGTLNQRQMTYLRRHRRKAFRRRTGRISVGKRQSTGIGISRRLRTKLLAMPSGGIPDQKLVHLRYSETRIHDEVSGVISVDAYNLNGIFDPQGVVDSTSVSGQQSNAQPLYRDQWIAFYNNYRVLYAKFTVEFTNLSAVACRVGIVPAAVDLGSQADTIIVAERPYARFANLSSNTGGSNVKTLSVFLPCWEIIGVTKSYYMGDLLFSAAQGANPTNVAHGNVFVQAIDGSSTMNVNAKVNIDYYVQYFYPIREQTGS